MSPPAEKARSPAAVTTTRVMAPSRAHSASFAASARTIPWVTALSALDRFRVMIPAAVRTDFVSTSNRDAPDAWDEAERTAALARVRHMLDGGLDPGEVGEYAVDAMLRGDFFIFSYPDFREQIAARQAELLQAIPRDRPLTHPG